MKYSIELPVQFRDVDCLGHVNSAVYLQYMETARIEFARSLGRIEHHFHPNFIIAAAQCEYQRPIVDERSVIVSLWVSRIGKRSWDLDYVIGNPAGATFAVGRTIQVGFDYDRGLAVAISRDLMKDLENHHEEPLSFKRAAGTLR